MRKLLRKLYCKFPMLCIKTHNRHKSIVRKKTREKKGKEEVQASNASYEAGEERREEKREERQEKREEE